jgi:protein-S-isoprenylcysteine O-methyltransferase Ste14
MTIPDAFAFLVVILWPIIPFWWIPVHGANKLVKKLGFAIYPIIFVVWFFIAYLIYSNRVFLLEFRIDFSIIIRIIGILFSFAGTLLQLWTLKVLTARVITGVPELRNGAEANLVTTGPFSRVRHPTYLSHTLFFTGIFLSTGIVSTGFVALIDFFVVILVIIPMEENELRRRFGNEYRYYMVRIPRFIPRIKGRATTINHTKATDSRNSSKLA